MRVLSKIVLGATLSFFCVEAGFGLTSEEFSGCYETHKDDSVWPSYNFHKCILKHNRFNHTLSQNMVIKNCQRFRDDFFLPQRISNYISEALKLIEECSSETQKLIQYLNELSDSDSQPIENFKVDNIYMHRLATKIEIIMYYEYYFLKNSESALKYRKESTVLVNNIKILIIPASQKISVLLAQISLQRSKNPEKSLALEGTDILVTARNVVTNLSDALELLPELYSILENTRSATLGDFVAPAQPSGKSVSDEDKTQAMYKCINKSLLNSNALTPYNFWIEQDSPLGWHLAAMRSTHAEEYRRVKLAKEYGLEPERTIIEKNYNYITDYIEKKVKKVFGITRNDYFDVVKIEQAAEDKPTILLNNLNAYDSQLEWVVNEYTDEDPDKSKELIDIIHKEFDVLTEYGILAEAQVMFS